MILFLLLSPLFVTHVHHTRGGKKNLADHGDMYLVLPLSNVKVVGIINNHYMALESGANFGHEC